MAGQKVGSVRRVLASVLIAGVCAIVPPAAAQGSGGTSALPFFLEPADPVRAALGGAYSAKSGDATALFANPAALRGSGLEAFATHTELEQGFRLETVGLAVPMPGGALSIGASFAHVSGLEGRDEQGNSTGASVAYGATMLRAAYERVLGGVLSAGAGIEVLSQSIDGTTGSSVAATAGILARTPAADLSLVADHVGSGFQAGGAEEALPRTVRAGGRLHAVPGLDVLAEWSTSAGGLATGSGGLEYRFAGLLSLRAGYHRDLTGDSPLSGVSGGLGVSLGGWEADYGISGDSGQSPVHRFGLRVGLGGVPAAATAPDAPAPPAPRPAGGS
jgi:hypothetical protein